ncbi:putative monooxygenase YxeK (plasmid) [Cupriavidus taiwanensis]|uniref:Putative monooxygenase YxeK n=1 Tax=Cupriavidus taiwanensis TaxID=164546 RepID=A0A375I9E6_9BURK|nr:LLM class flavin-dependent oxidoreductase [Cupriavidus taiwanensis]SPK70501.1 putative monooxygenase YxeK [Cupriavidus taiwanensis]SPK77133.1 putative monooxygenase YxeK [Cupriavidus taiwanensis]
MTDAYRQAPRQLHLGAFVMATGHHVAGWRHPDAHADAGRSLSHYAALARRAEAAGFDALFLADGVAIRGMDDATLPHTARAATFEPLTLLSALAAVTQRIGLVATASTTYNEPYHIARKFASLDHLSGGRAGWNVVTSWSDAEARNFSLDRHPEHADRYARAEEFVDVVSGLWDSWEDDAFLYDKAGGVHFDASKLHRLDHRGKYFQVRGPLNISRPPQGHPVIVQAGSSEAGQELAARTAEVIFTAQQSLEGAQAFYRGLKGRLARFGRTPDQLKILPGVFPVVGRSAAEAEEKFESLQDLILPSVGLALLSQHLGGIDLSGYPLDGPLPDNLQEPNGAKSRFQLVTGLAREERLTIRQLCRRVATARGHWSIHGTPAQIVDQLQAWFEAEAADGFNVMPPWLPGGLDDFIELVLPELRRRGLFREQYTGTTLREHLGLVRPGSMRRERARTA